MKLYELTRDIEEINSLVEAGDIEASDAIDTLDGMKLAVKEKGLNITALVLNEEASISALKEAEEKIALRRKKKQKKIEWLKSYLLDGMEANGISKIECPDFVVSLAKCPPKVELIEDAQKLLVDKWGDRFVRTKVVVSVDKQELQQALKAGEEISGARLTQSNRLKFS
mgnify:CR=1 FL=1|tara:strand:- start:1140 stop:1646 length:507 start_codon:yes stop_codon:yes gene_type:complete